MLHMLFSRKGIAPVPVYKDEFFYFELSVFDKWYKTFTLGSFSQASETCPKQNSKFGVLTEFSV